MVLKRNEWPQVEEYLVAIATKVTTYGVYVILPEYGNKEGFIHISEVSSTWVRNIRNYIHEDQRVVVKVLQVDPHKKHIDLSLRRVSADAKRNKNEEWKRAQKAEKLLEIIANKNNMTLEEAYKQIGWPIEDRFGEIYKGFEVIGREGPSALQEMGISEDVAQQLMELIRDKIETPTIEIDGELSVQVPGPEGVEILKKALIQGVQTGNLLAKDSTTIYVVGPPRYRLKIVSHNYKDAEQILAAVIDSIKKIVEPNDGTVSFTRK